MTTRAETEQDELILSTRAQAVGLRTAADAKVAFVRQASYWWHGTLYYCPLCDVEFHRAQNAAHHLVEHQHPVLRWGLVAAHCQEADD